MSDDTKRWVAELLRKNADGDSEGVRKMLEDERASSPFHPNRAETDDAGKLRFYWGDKEVFMHPDKTFHDKPFNRD